MKAIRIASFVIAAVAIFALAMPLTSNAQQSPSTAVPTAAGTASASIPASANAVITSPVLVSELHGVVQVMGTANVTGMRSYFLEARPLNADASAPASDAGWLPATLPASTAVQNGVLASWDTTLLPDGLYELRLNVTRDNALSTTFVVTPLRINNAPYMAATTAATQAAGSTTGVATVTAQLSANVRSGDSVYYAIVGYLTHGSSASVLGVSSASGWYYIQLSDGTKGWIAPNVVVKSGDFSSVPVVTPPPGVPIFTATPVAGLIVNGIALAPAAPVCGQSFNVSVNVTNPGTATSATDKVYVQDVNQSAAVAGTAVGAIPAINPGGNYVVVVPLTITTYYNAVHQVQATIDGSQITTTYTLAQGDCNKGSASATSVPATAVPATVVPASPTSVPPTITSIPSPTLTVAPSATS